VSSKSREVILIGDPRIKGIPVVDCGEPLVDLSQVFSALTFDFDRKFVQKESASICFARRTIGEMLSKAQHLLPEGIRLLVKECHRPMAIQKSFWDGYLSYLRKKMPTWSETELYNECSKLNAPLEVAPHTTGGAVDLTLIDHNGSWFDMGTEFNASPLHTAEATYTRATNISSGAQRNRRLLIDAMNVAGFVNYPTEWWHWSYGDKYWCFVKGKAHAIYGSIEMPGQDVS
jgi:D-alanyl-D-alanine dipeptidase